MINTEEIECFLDNWNEQLKKYDIVYQFSPESLARDLNLELYSRDKVALFHNLTCGDYVEGPYMHTRFSFDYWMFKCVYNRKDLICNISCGWGNSPVICLSIEPYQVPIKISKIVNL